MALHTGRELPAAARSGTYGGKQRVDIVKAMGAEVGVPKALVARRCESGGELGEAAGIHEDDVKRAVTEGIAKISTDTDLRLAFSAALREGLNKPGEFDPRKILGPARDELKRIGVEVFGSVGRA